MKWAHLIIGLEMLIFISILVILVVLAIRRIKERSKETFEKRNN